MGRSVLVILAHAHDIGARAVARVLARHDAPVLVPVVVDPAHLSRARWSHRIGATGVTETRLTLGDGRVLADGEIGCVLNRIEYLPVPHFDTATDRDRDYAAMEMQAVVASWLFSLDGRVVNRPNARAIDAGPTSQRAWLALAAEHGLPVVSSAVATSARLLNDLGGFDDAPVRPLGPWVPGERRASTGRVPVRVEWSSDGSAPTAADMSSEVLVAGTRAVGPGADRWGAACVAVASTAGCLLAGFGFRVDRGEARLYDVVTRPTLEHPWAVAATADLILSITRRQSDVS